MPERKKRRVELHKLMKTGKIPLKDIVPGAEVRDLVGVLENRPVIV